MKAAEALLATASAAGIEVMFANPGTTEMPLVMALDTALPGRMRTILGLHENVVTGAADGYGRMTGKPALTLLHLGPGFANGIANLHNAKRARSPIVNLIGEQATWHGTPHAPLASDIESLARPVSGWVGRAADAAEVVSLGAAAIAAAQKGAGSVATLILPHDLQLAEGQAPVAPLQPRPRSQVSDTAVATAAATLKAGAALLFLGNAALSEAGLKAAGRIAQATGAAIMSQSSNGRAERGAGLPPFSRLPYLPEMAMAALQPYARVLLAGALSPVTFFGWPGYPSSPLAEGTEVVTLAAPDDDIVGALEALAGHLDAPAYEAPAVEAPEMPADGPLTAEAMTAVLAALQPEGTVLVNEAITSGWRYHPQSVAAPRFTELQVTGGAIGLGPALALGAAVAAPGRTVIDLQADGSALYSLQALWSQARQGARVVTIICANRRYGILELEMTRAGVNRPGPAAAGMTDLAGVDWCALAQGFGVAAERAESLADFTAALRRALAADGPALIEAALV